MNRLTDNKIILVTRPTRLAELVQRFNTVAQAKFYVEHLGADFSDYLAEDETYSLAVRDTVHVLDGTEEQNPRHESGELILVPLLILLR